MDLQVNNILSQEDDYDASFSKFYARIGVKGVFLPLLSDIVNIGDGVNKSKELFNPEIVQGNLDIIAPWVFILGTAVMALTSFGGFTVVMSSIMKMVLHMMVAAWPTFFRGIHDLKENSKKEGGGKGIKGIISLLISFIPDFWAWTDFLDERWTAVSWFTKSIPVATVTIFMGVFVWVGYHAVFANKIASVGIVATEAVLISFDPVQLVKGAKIDAFISPDINTGNSGVNEDIELEKAIKSAYATISTAASDMSPEAKTSVAGDLESKLRPLVNQLFSDPEFSARYVEKGYTVDFRSVMTDDQDDKVPVDRVLWTGEDNATGRVAIYLDFKGLPTGTSKQGIKQFVKVVATANKKRTETKNVASNVTYKVGMNSQNNLDGLLYEKDAKNPSNPGRLMPSGVITLSQVGDYVCEQQGDATSDNKTVKFTFACYKLAGDKKSNKSTMTVNFVVDNNREAKGIYQGFEVQKATQSARAIIQNEMNKKFANQKKD